MFSEQEDSKVSIKLLNPVASRKKERVTIEQKEYMLYFIKNNPELLSYSISTVERARELWTKLASELNQLKPEKSQPTWREYWQKWKTKVRTNPEKIVTIADYKLKKLLQKHDQWPLQFSDEEIYDQLNKIEKEVVQLNIVYDTLSFEKQLRMTHVNKLSEEINQIQRAGNENRKKLKMLMKKKKDLNILSKSQSIKKIKLDLENSTSH